MKSRSCEYFSRAWHSGAGGNSAASKTPSMAKDPAVYILHILDAISNIEMDTVDYDFQKFRSDRRARQLVERNLEILSEASRRLSDELKAAEPQIPWRAVAGIGNVVRHDYHETY